ncbi:MAG: DUF1318 domain-containing protein [Desulfobacterales bacterium]|nr:MAG: DUF1318 domain-containing protein [Desulfobacterales bacterium]
MRWNENRVRSIDPLIILIFLTGVVGCTLAHVKVDVVSERTALENQVLGTYNALDQEMLLVASVRGVDSSGRIQQPPKQSQEQQDAILAVQTLAFHADDLQIFRRLGWVGEDNAGHLVAFPMALENVPEEFSDFARRYPQDEFAAVIEAINRAREVMMRRVIAMNENFTEADLPQIRQVFAKLNRENAQPGEKIQAEDGSWTVKK